MKLQQIQVQHAADMELEDKKLLTSVTVGRDQHQGAELFLMRIAGARGFRVGNSISRRHDIAMQKPDQHGMTLTVKRGSSPAESASDGQQASAAAPRGVRQ